MRFLGIDYGDKRIGLAIGDDETNLAAPLEVIKNEGEITVNLLAKRIRNEDIDAIVVGVPVADGAHHGPEQFEKTKRFMDRLKLQVTVPMFEEDERYTSAESQRIRRETGSRVEEDALAAMVILQSFFNRTSEGG